MVDQAPLALRGAGQQHLLDDLGQGVRCRFHCAGERVAPQGAESDRFVLHLLTRFELKALVVHHDQHAVPFHHRPDSGIVKRHDRDPLQVDVLPDVQLGPVGQREDPDALPRLYSGIVEVPQLRALVLGIPAVIGAAKGKNPLLGSGFFLVPAGSAEGGVELVAVQRLLQSLGLHDVGVERRAVGKGGNPLADPLLVDMHDEVQAAFGRHPVTELDHLAEFPGSVNVQQGKWRRGRVKGLACQVQHDRRVLADGVEHHRVGEFGHHLADDVDTFCFELL